MKLTEVICSCCGGTGKEIDQEATAGAMKALRSTAGLSLQDVSDSIAQLHGEEYGTSYLSKLEHGRNRWNPRLVTLWEDACG